MDGEGVHAARKLVGQGGIDHAMALEPGLPPQRLSHDIDPEMCLSTRPVAGMARMVFGFVDHPQALGIESFGQLPYDVVGDAHVPFA